MKKLLKSSWVILLAIMILAGAPRAWRYAQAMLGLPVGTIAEHIFSGVDSAELDMVMIETTTELDDDKLQYTPETFEQILEIIGAVPINAARVSKDQWVDGLPNGITYMVFDFNGTSIQIDITRSGTNILRVTQHAKKSWKHLARPIDQQNYYTTAVPLDIDKLYEVMSGGIEMGAYDFALKSLQKMSGVSEISLGNYCVSVGETEYSGGFAAAYPVEEMLDVLNKTVVKTLPALKNEQLQHSPVAQTPKNTWSVKLSGNVMAKGEDGVSDVKPAEVYIGSVIGDRVVIYVSYDGENKVAAYDTTVRMQPDEMENICKAWVAKT